MQYLTFLLLLLQAPALKLALDIAQGRQILLVNFGKLSDLNLSLTQTHQSHVIICWLAVACLGRPFCSRLLPHMGLMHAIMVSETTKVPGSELSYLL